jgi:hypothetical protein
MSDGRLHVCTPISFMIFLPSILSTTYENRGGVVEYDENLFGLQMAWRNFVGIGTTPMIVLKFPSVKVIASLP